MNEPTTPSSPVEIPQWIASLPKAELHLHLEGTATAETLAALAQARRRESPPLEALQKKLRFHNFLGFLLAFKYVVEQLQEPTDYGFLLQRLMQNLHGQNVKYAEVTLAGGGVLVRKLDFDRVMEALLEEQERTLSECPVEIRWVVDAVRNFGTAHVEEVAGYALGWAKRSDKVVAFGIGGDERLGPARWFRKTFDKVREAGLHVTVHAGETGGPNSIWQALRDLGAERIGHGLSAFKDPELVAYLNERQIPLEVCPMSNLRTGALRQHTKSNDLAAHPILDYVRHGLCVTLNTDDPGIFDTRLNGEYARAETIGLTREELIRVAETSFQSVFCVEPLKSRLLERFRESVVTLPPT